MDPKNRKKLIIIGFLVCVVLALIYITTRKSSILGSPASAAAPGTATNPGSAIVAVDTLGNLQNWSASFNGDNLDVLGNITMHGTDLCIVNSRTPNAAAKQLPAMTVQNRTVGLTATSSLQEVLELNWNSGWAGGVYIDKFLSVGSASGGIGQLLVNGNDILFSIQTLWAAVNLFQSGTTTFIPGGSTSDGGSVVFPRPYNTPPVVVITPYNVTITDATGFFVKSVTAKGFTFYVNNYAVNSVSGPGPFTMNWMASGNPN